MRNTTFYKQRNGGCSWTKHFCAFDKKRYILYQHKNFARLNDIINVALGNTT